jgi:hypothetical protein
MPAIHGSCSLVADLVRLQQQAAHLSLPGGISRTDRAVLKEEAAYPHPSLLEAHANAAPEVGGNVEILTAENIVIRPIEIPSLLRLAKEKLLLLRAA